MSECDHRRVYSSMLLTSSPPIATWICSKCGVKDRHFLWENDAPAGWSDLNFEMFLKRAANDAEEFRALNEKYFSARSDYPKSEAAMKAEVVTATSRKLTATWSLECEKELTNLKNNN